MAFKHAITYGIVRMQVYSHEIHPHVLLKQLILEL